MEKNNDMILMRDMKPLRGVTIRPNRITIITGNDSDTIELTMQGISLMYYHTKRGNHFDRAHIVRYQFQKMAQYTGGSYPTIEFYRGKNRVINYTGELNYNNWFKEPITMEYNDEFIDSLPYPIYIDPIVGAERHDDNYVYMGSNGVYEENPMNTIKFFNDLIDKGNKNIVPYMDLIHDLINILQEPGNYSSNESEINCLPYLSREAMYVRHFMYLIISALRMYAPENQCIIIPNFGDNLSAMNVHFMTIALCRLSNEGYRIFLGTRSEACMDTINTMLYVNTCFYQNHLKEFTSEKIKGLNIIIPEKNRISPEDLVVYQIENGYSYDITMRAGDSVNTVDTDKLRNFYDLTYSMIEEIDKEFEDDGLVSGHGYIIWRSRPPKGNEKESSIKRYKVFNRLESAIGEIINIASSIPNEWVDWENAPEFILVEHDNVETATYSEKWNGNTLAVAFGMMHKIEEGNKDDIFEELKRIYVREHDSSNPEEYHMSLVNFGMQYNPVHFVYGASNEYKGAPMRIAEDAVNISEWYLYIQDTIIQKLGLKGK